MYFYGYPKQFFSDFCEKIASPFWECDVFITIFLLEYFLAPEANQAVGQ